MRRFFVPIILLLSLALGLFQAANVGFTTDEGIHVASAYLAIERGDFRFDPEHPFLFKYLTALPLFALKLQKPANDSTLWKAAEPTFYDSWQESRSWADNWFYSSGNPTELMVFLSRIPGVLAFVGLLYALYVLVKLGTKQRLAAEFSLLVAAITPTFLGHAPTTNTDIPLALATVLVLIALYKYFLQPAGKTSFFVGLALLVAVTTKFSGVILLVPALLWALYTWKSKKLSVKKLLTHLGIVFITIWAGIWLVYGFASPYQAIAPSQEQEAFTKIRHILSEYHIQPENVVFTRYILPSGYFKGLAMTTVGSTTGRGTYLLGHREQYGGLVWYFPALLILKTQFSLLAALLLGAVITVRKLAKPKAWSPFVHMLAITAVIISAVLIHSKLNIGFRHASTLLPIVAIGIGSSLALLFEQNRKIAYVFVAFAILPFFYQKSFDPISFANTPINPLGQWRIYDDSNLDWGQEIKPAAALIKQKYPNEKVYYNPWRSTEAWEHYLGKPVYSFSVADPPSDGIIVLSASQRANASFSYRFTDTYPIETIGNGTAFIYRF